MEFQSVIRNRVVFCAIEKYQKIEEQRIVRMHLKFRYSLQRTSGADRIQNHIVGPNDHPRGRSTYFVDSRATDVVA